MILGCDAAGLDEDGNEVVVHAVVSDPSWTGDETLDPKRSLLSERYQGTFADRSSCPGATWCPSRPRSASRRRPACPTAWLTAYRMLYTPGRSQARRQRPGAGRRRWRGDGADRARPGRRPAGLRHQPRRGQAQARARPRRPRGLREQRAAAAARRRRHGDGRQGDLVAQRQVAAPRRHAGRVRYDERAGRRERRADPGVLPPAAGDRLDHGHPPGARGADRPARRERRPPGDRPGAADGAGADGFAAMHGGDLFGKVVFTR